jgi:WD40 repeat protein
LFTALAISADGRWVASSQEPPENTAARVRGQKIPIVSSELRIRDSRMGAIRRTFKAFSRNVIQTAFAPQGDTVATVDFDGLALWSLADGRPLWRVSDERVSTGLVVDHQRSHLAFDRVGNHLVFVFQGTIDLLDAATGKRLWRATSQAGRFSGAAFSPDGERLVVAHGEEVKIWDVAQGHELLTLPRLGGRIGALTFTPDGRRAIAALEDGRAEIWE